MAGAARPGTVYTYHWMESGDYAPHMNEMRFLLWTLQDFLSAFVGGVP
jgi:hypothetical protein